MAEKRLFTREQVAVLNANPYTHKATENRISFTIAFKEFFYAKVQEGNLSNPAIFKEAGYDPAVLGQFRIDSIRKQILSEAASEEGFHSPRGLSHADELEKIRTEAEQAASTDAKVKCLESRISHLEAQVEFLKKTAAIRKKYHQTPQD